MKSKRIVAVVGGTGAQGGGVARAILNDPESSFSARILTRQTQSDKARALARQGAEIVFADLDDRESVQLAFDGAFAAFCVTNYWEHFSPEREMAQALTMARASKHVGLQHVIWSTLEDTRRWIPLESERMPTIAGKYKVPHFDGKGESNRFFIENDVPTTFLLTSFYWDNLIHFGMGPRRASDGDLTIAFPMDDKKLPGIAAEDIGRCAYGILKSGAAWIGKTVGIAGEQLTCAQMAAGLTCVLGEVVRYDPVSPDAYRNLRFRGAADLANMFQFKRDFEDVFCHARDVELSRHLNPSLQTFGAWLAQNKTRLLTDE